MAQKISEILLRIWILTFSIGVTKVGPFPVKTLVFALFVICAVYLLIKKNYVVAKHKFGLCLLFVWLVFATNVGFVNGFDESTLSQGSSLIATFFVVIFTFILYENELLNVKKVVKSIYLSAGIGVVIKAFLGLGVVFGYFAAESIDDLMQNYAGSTSFHADAYGGFLGLLPRIGNAGDLFNLVVFLFYIKKHSGARVAIAWMLMLTFVLVTYSRYLILLFLLATLYAAGFNIKDKSKAAVVVIMAILLAAIVRYTESDVIFLEIEERFTGYAQSQSDSIREEMRKILLTSFGSNPILGVGVGGYIREYLRSPINLWQYEMEYLALLMQLGILGFIFIVMNFIIYVLRMLLSGYDKALKIPLALSIIFWIGTPIQSSLFSGTQSAVIVLSIFFLSRRVERSEPVRRSKRTDPGHLATNLKTFRTE